VRLLVLIGLILQAQYALSHVKYDCHVKGQTEEKKISGRLNFEISVHSGHYITLDETMLQAGVQRLDSAQVEVQAFQYIQPEGQVSAQGTIKAIRVKTRLKGVRFGSEEFVLTGVPGFHDIDHSVEDITVDLVGRCQLTF
jgi:hypothetical protein